MSNTTRGRGAGETLVEQGRAALGEARRPLLAVVGAGDLAVRQLREQLRDLPRQAPVRRLSERAADLQGRVRSLNSAAVRETVEAYVSQVRSTYQDLAERGEEVLARSRARTTQPGVRGALDALLGRSGGEQPAGAAATTVESVRVEVLPGPDDAVADTATPGTGTGPGTRVDGPAAS
jgi:histone H3/H4